MAPKADLALLSALLQVRSSYGMFIPRHQDETMAAIEQRVSQWTGVPVIHQEDTQVCYTCAGLVVACTPHHYLHLQLHLHHTSQRALHHTSHWRCFPHQPLMQQSPCRSCGTLQVRTMLNMSMLMSGWPPF